MSIYKILKKRRFVNRNGDLSRFLAGTQVGGCKKNFDFVLKRRIAFAQNPV